MKKIMFALTACSMLTLQFCASSKKTAISQPPAKITYLADVQPLVTAHCSPCHIPPKGFKKALDNLDAVKNNIDEILQRINLNPGEKAALIAFLGTLTDEALRTDPRFADPFVH